MSLGPISAGAPRLGDVANLARSVDRLEGLEIRMSRVEAKLDRALEILLALRPDSIPRRR
jgi:hypothetical protein